MHVGCSYMLFFFFSSRRRHTRCALVTGVQTCALPILLEPITQVRIATPSGFTAKAQGIISRRRGQILGFDAKQGWPGWDEVLAYLPQAELHDLIVELRSATLGVGTFEWKFDHLAELTGRDADSIIAQRKAAE